MKTRIGNQTAWFSPPLVPFDFALSQGFDAFEWFPDRHGGRGWDIDELDAVQRQRVAAASALAGLRLSVHAPLDASLWEDGGSGRWAECFAFASDVGAALVNVHLEIGRGIDEFADALESALAEAARYGLMLSVENTPVAGPEAFNVLFDTLQARGYPEARVGMCLDLGHANLFQDTRNDYLRYVDRLGAHVPIVHVHLHENWGDTDSHLPMFTGPSRHDDAGVRGFLERMRRRGFDGVMILEHWPSLPSMLVEERTRLLEMAHVRIAVEEPQPDQLERFVEVLAGADKVRPSWRQKLELVADTLDEMGPGDLDSLACIAVYLRFVGTGALPCGESGGHYRPNHHAALARRIRRRLAQIATARNRPLLRRIHPWLPSSRAPYTSAEPLTRIRDIAHRNDIPPDLKERIKRTLQNKLHRSADPQDLRTSQTLLDEVLASRDSYPASFVRELQAFHDELKEFFQAHNLTEQLGALCQGNDQAAGPLARELLDAMSDAARVRGALRALDLLVQLRIVLSARLQGPDADDEAQILDVRLEEQSFVLLSQIANQLTEPAGTFPWRLTCNAWALAARALGLDGVHPDECSAVEREVMAWSRGFDGSDRRHLLRLKATADRSRRLTDSYADTMLAIWPRTAEKLGEALDVGPAAIRMFAEGEVRRHLGFQLSRIIDAVLREIRVQAALPPWDCVVPGAASGRLLAAESLSELQGAEGESLIALVNRVDPDDDLAPGIVGVLCSGTITHLSHFAVRARHAGVAVACHPDTASARILGELVGKPIAIEADVNGLAFHPGPDSRGSVAAKPPAPGPVIRPARLDVQELVALDEVQSDVGGAKAAGARRLRELLRSKGPEVDCPDGVVIPFGVFRACLAADPVARSVYEQLVAQLPGADEVGREIRVREIRRVVEQLSVPAGVLSQVAARFGPDVRLMVRSSSSFEDLPGYSAAGLYDTVGNVSPDHCAQAIRRVWASLWNARALHARLRANLAADAGEMAVLVQPMVQADLAFVLHTTHPATRQRGDVYLEAAVGMGETIVRGDEHGTPYRVVFHRATGRASVLSYASWSTSRVPDGAGAWQLVRVHYDEQPLTRDLGRLEALGARLGELGGWLEDSLGRPQDVEGVVRGHQISLVQSRPQEGL